MNQRCRCSAEPWVHDSGLTRPEVFFWIRSSPTDSAASMASRMSSSVSSAISTWPSASSVFVADRVGLHEAAVRAAELLLEHLVEEAGVEVDRVVLRAVERADLRAGRSAAG